MTREFNITGTCIPGMHYMADTSEKIEKAMALIRKGHYSTINRPRQYGKTTTLFLLEQVLKKDSQYLVIDISFEVIDDPTYADQSTFIPTFLDLMRKSLAFNREKELADFINSQNALTDFNRVSNFITEFIEKAQRRVVLLIDEVDKASNNRLFLDFLGMLRNKYLRRNEGKDFTFYSVILAGVHDVKTLESQIRPDEEKKYNSPWNIAADFDVELSLSAAEIGSMLNDYAVEQQVEIDIPFISEKLVYYTSGYPFLVSLICKIIDEKILPEKKQKKWTVDDLEKAFQIAIKKDATNFDTLIKNLENNPELYDLVFKIIMNGAEISFNTDNPVIRSGIIYGIIKMEKEKAKIHNRVYEQRIYNYMSSKMETAGDVNFSQYNNGTSYIETDGSLNLERVIRKFQQFMNEQYSLKDKNFIERNGRLLFLAFIKPIINGRGFDFKEVQVGEEKRLDVVITFDNRKYIIELKLWRGNAYHLQGIRQLCEYLDSYHEKSGYLLIYDLRKESGQTGEVKTIEEDGKKILVAWV